MTTTTPTTFAAVLTAWLLRNRLADGRAARFLGITPRELRSWCNGTMPAPDRVALVLARIGEKE